MILVTLGTQDKSFERLLKVVDKAIDDKIINEEVIAQIGQTKYESKNMKCFDFLDADEFQKYLLEARIIISHGGVGTISKAVKLHKPVIAAPRLEMYGEHHNDHQVQIIERLELEKSLIPLWKMEDLKECLEKAEHFDPNPIESNNSHFISIIREYINKL